ncbi:conserved hypothetical protein [Desulfamplus magnetovallimortis]|uniref:3'-phosphate/5'-hydroxy nucleic acid ligase n=1 Tax=Desulfamplus magnetovallimortis TaxID=1246637 RepID=A0A1W1H9K0_9BACT|nr:RtcB family protein [Desulfamplus magnetovallimortis]SLM29119.1 conserved hypothetical protein [Desulfamplus magnetovallimortis]
MKQVITTEQKPIKLWLDDIDNAALDQAKNLANLPFIFKHVAIMPDSHLGYGMPIGGVMATQNIIVPNAVGVDIGCGMCAVQTSMTEIDTNTLKGILGKIRMSIPLGFKHHSREQADWIHSCEASCKFIKDGIIEKEYKASLKQVGTLGGGNHFIEIQRGSDGHIWIMIHSGSRNMGLKVAKHYNDLAIKMNEKWFSSVPKKWELAFLPLDDEIGRAYFTEMNCCVEFALTNRQRMLDVVKKIFKENTHGNVDFGEMINIAHNYAAVEKHFGEKVVVHRKGATRAFPDQTGIIPGSQGSSSYIVKGKGNPDSFMSCSHGAGRKLGRKQAQRELNLKAEQERLDRLGVLHALRGKKSLDEAAGAYKDISVVMENQSDLVDIDVELRPLAVVKG